MTQRRFVLVDFRYTSGVVGHIRLYEAGSTYDMPRALAHAAAKRVAARRLGTAPALNIRGAQAGSCYLRRALKRGGGGP
jgi:hypothetical protein